MKFKSLSKEDLKVQEDKINEYWSSIDILKSSIENRKDNKTYVFYDGPAFANGFPGLHHMLSKFLKDSICKYKTMKGYKILRKVGWDTHGLPIENYVEKKLGFKDKKDIEKFGIENFNNECRNSVRENEEAFVNLTKKMGQFIDTDNPYLTYKNEYIETEWWILKKFFDEGLFYEGNKVMPYCPRCETGLASHEVAQGYEDINVETVTVPFKLKDEDAYFLVWTTTPWTLIANVALCVNPEASYVKVESNGNKFILAESLASSILGEDYKVIKKYKGLDLEYIQYEQLLPYLEVDKKSFYVTCDSYVTMETGTGIVHIAPAFGEDDASVGRNYDLPILNPVGVDGCYKEGPWKNILVFEADKLIIEHLKSEGKILKKQKMIHNYPHCWRCSSPLLYYSMPSYYISVSKLRNKLVENNKKVNWYPTYVGEKRFENWLANAKDWAVSRTRYWGAPIPYWKCECGHNEMIGSVEELKSKSIEEINKDTIDLHKPYIDNIHVKCPKCGKAMNRISDVLDCWFDSGAMPFAQYHYPFENSELWESQFPADFICEGIDQTRGWFYTLLVISTFVKGTSPFKNVLVNDLLLDSEGKKMSKSRGNIIEPFTTIEKYGADAVRFYLAYVSPVWTPIKFDENGVKEVISKFFNTLKNTYTFFELYANTDEIDPREYKIEYEQLDLIDKWLLSKYNNLVKNVTEEADRYDINKVVHLIQDFVCEDLSNWYIRRNRRRFWESELTISKKGVYQTTYEVLVGISKLLAPISPFISEELYRNLTNEKSVHLTDYPVCDENLIDKKIEEQMDTIIEFIVMGRNSRELAKIKIRQPINEVILDSKYKNIIGNLEELVKEELNVKKLTYVSDMKEYVNIIYKPNFKEIGSLLGSSIKEFQNYLTNISEDDVKLLNENKLTIKLNGNAFNVFPSMVLMFVTPKKGYNSAYLNNKVIVLNTELTEELLLEGLAREFNSKIQNMRKDMDFEVTDRIKIFYEPIKEIEEMISKYKNYIKEETLCLEFIKDDSGDEIKINDLLIHIKIEKFNK